MSTGDGGSNGEWQSFARRIAEVTEMPPEEINPDMRLMQGLGLDSLGLAELVIALRETYEASGRQIDVEGRNWETITVGQLFNDLTGSRAPARA
jgi:acyl carrier protein